MSRKTIDHVIRITLCADPKCDRVADLNQELWHPYCFKCASSMITRTIIVKAENGKVVIDE